MSLQAASSSTERGSSLAAPRPPAASVADEPVELPPIDTPYVRWFKPMFDRTVAAVTLIVLSPLISAIAFGVLVTMGRPIIYKQRRIGVGGEPFLLWKFRTMHPDRRCTDAAVAVPVDRRVRHKTTDDPRHTPFGTFLRRTSVDELPQLLNIVAGQMSIVGPRPEMVELVNRYEPWQHHRHSVRPGLTGLWQVSNRGSGMMHEHTHIDIEYLRMIGFRADLKIMLRTPLALLRRGGS